MLTVSKTHICSSTACMPAQHTSRSRIQIQYAIMLGNTSFMAVPEDNNVRPVLLYELCCNWVGVWRTTHNVQQQYVPAECFD